MVKGQGQEITTHGPTIEIVEMAVHRVGHRCCRSFTCAVSKVAAAAVAVNGLFVSSQQLAGRLMLLL